MIKTIIAIAFFFTAIRLSAQDSTWKKIRIDENVSVVMPSKIVLHDTLFEKKGHQMRLRIYETETAYAKLGVTITPSETNMNVDNPESLEKALRDIATGACNATKAQGYSCSITDTIIDNIRGKKIKAFVEDAENYSTMYNYIFLLNDKMYMFTSTYFTLSSLTSYARKESEKFLNSIHFKKSAIQEQKFPSRAASTGYRIGRLIGSLILPALLVLIIVYFVKKR